MGICSEDIYDLHVPNSNNDIIVLIYLLKKYFLQAIPESTLNVKLSYKAPPIPSEFIRHRSTDF